MVRSNPCQLYCAYNPIVSVLITYNPIATLLGYLRGLEVGNSYTYNWVISTLNLRVIILQVVLNLPWWTDRLGALVELGA